jgi:hypothetical protein
LQVIAVHSLSTCRRRREKRRKGQFPKSRHRKSLVVRRLQIPGYVIGTRVFSRLYKSLIQQDEGWCRGGELNSLRRPFQGRALPVSYPGNSVDKRLYGGLRPDASSWIRELGGWGFAGCSKFADCNSEVGFARGICFFLASARKQIPRFGRDDNGMIQRANPAIRNDKSPLFFAACEARARYLPGNNANVQIEPPAGTLAAP